MDERRIKIRRLKEGSEGKKKRRKVRKSRKRQYGRDLERRG